MSSDDTRITPDELATFEDVRDITELTLWDQDPWGSADVGAETVAMARLGQTQRVLVHGDTVLWGGVMVTAEHHQPLNNGQIAVLDVSTKWTLPEAKAEVLRRHTRWADTYPDNDLLAELVTSMHAEDAELLELVGGWDGDRIDALLEQIEHDNQELIGDQDDVPEVAAGSTICKLGDTWQLGDHTLICGDAFVEELPECGALISDPPYGMKVDTSWYGNVAPSQFQSLGKLEWDQDEFNPERFIAHSNTCALFGANFYCHKLSGPGTWWVWDKRSSDADDEVWGAGWGIQFELAWISVQVAHKIIRHKWAGFVKDSDDEKVHPTQKPIAVMREFVETLTEPGQTILDPFGGSGSTLMACEATGRVCHAIELDPHYCDVICKRFQLATDVRPVLTATGDSHDFVGASDGS